MDDDGINLTIKGIKIGIVTSASIMRHDVMGGKDYPTTENLFQKDIETGVESWDSEPLNMYYRWAPP
jgi:hypothetical protein